MTTSNVTIYELDRDDIISAAMRKIGALGKGETPDTEDLSNGQQALNAIIAQFQTLGMPMWARKEYSLTLVSGQRDYTFGVGQTTNTAFPLKIIRANLVQTSGGSSQEVLPIARSDFVLLNTTSTGRPVNYTYQPYVNYGVVSVWPLPDASTVSGYTMKLTYQQPIQGFTSATETPDFPQEWQMPLIYNLAMALAPEFGLPIPDRQHLAKEAEKYLNTALDYTNEEASLYFQVERR